MTKEKIIVVNEKDEIIGKKERDSLKSSDIYRISVLWIQNLKGEILLSQRLLNKKKNPGKWGPAVAGTNAKGETYGSNIIKETKEEIGLENIEFKELNYYFNDQEGHRRFTKCFFALIDKKIEEFKIQKDEVEKVKWFKKKELLQKIEKNPEQFLEIIPKCIELGE